MKNMWKVHSSIKRKRSYAICVEFSKVKVIESELEFHRWCSQLLNCFQKEIKKKKWYLDFNPIFTSNKVRIFTKETQTREEGNDLLLPVFTLLGRRRTSYLGKQTWRKKHQTQTLPGVRNSTPASRSSRSLSDLVRSAHCRCRPHWHSHGVTDSDESASRHNDKYRNTQKIRRHTTKPATWEHMNNLTYGDYKIISLNLWNRGSDSTCNIPSRCYAVTLSLVIRPYATSTVLGHTMWWTQC